MSQVIPGLLQCSRILCLSRPPVFFWGRRRAVGTLSVLVGKTERRGCGSRPLFGVERRAPRPSLLLRRSRRRRGPALLTAAVVVVAGACKSSLAVASWMCRAPAKRTLWWRWYLVEDRLVVAIRSVSVHQEFLVVLVLDFEAMSAISIATE